MRTLDITAIYFYIGEYDASNKVTFEMLKHIIDICAGTNFIVLYGKLFYIYLHHEQHWTLLKDHENRSF